MSKRTMTCQQTKSYLEHVILPSDTNGTRNLYGGRLMEMIDSLAFLAFAKLTRMRGVTASMDQLDFVAPLPMGDSVHIETYVSGVSKRSVEIFVKVYGENLQTGQTYLAATAFLTFVTLKDQEGYDDLPEIIPTNEEERVVCEGYTERRQTRLLLRQHARNFQEALNLGSTND